MPSLPPKSAAEISAAAPASAPHRPPDLEPAQMRLIIGSIATLMLLASLDQTIVSTALPTIVSDLGGLDHLSWVVTAYILASTVVAPLYGKLGDLYGRRNIVFVSVGLFLTGSALCGLANSMTFLILSRALQGLGGGGLFVLALSVIGEVVKPEDRGKIQGVFAGVFSVSSVVGPLLGGWFVEAFTWHWIFYINIPIGIAAVTGFALSFKPTGRRVKHKIDWAGAASLSVTLASLTLITSLGGRTFDWASPEILVLGAVMIVAATLFIRVELRAPEPLLPLGLFKMNVFRVTNGIGFIAGAAMFGSVTFLPIYLQIVKGVTPTVSGLMLVPMTLGIMASSNVSGRVMSGSGRYRILPIVGCTNLLIGMLLLSTISAATPTWLFSIFILFVGVGMGGIFPVVTAAVQNSVPHAQLGTATAAGIMFRQIGGSMGVAAFGAIFAGRMAALMGDAGGTLNASGEIGPQMMAGLPPEMRAHVAQLVVSAIHPIFWCAAVLAIIGVLISLTLEEIPLLNRMKPKPTETPA